MTTQEIVYCVCGVRFEEVWLREDHFNTVDDMNAHGVPTPARLAEIRLHYWLRLFRDEVECAQAAMDGDSGDAEHDAFVSMTDTVEAFITDMEAGK